MYLCASVINRCPLLVQYGLFVHAWNEGIVTVSYKHCKLNALQWVPKVVSCSLKAKDNRNMFGLLLYNMIFLSCYFFMKHQWGLATHQVSYFGMFGKTIQPCITMYQNSKITAYYTIIPYNTMQAQTMVFSEANQWIQYWGIDFTKIQWNILLGHSVKVIFS